MNAIEKWLDFELRNWSRWCWIGSYPHPLPPRTCGSLEGDYIPPPWDGMDLIVRPPPPNEVNANLVDKVWRNLPENPKKVLRMEYPQRHLWEGAISGHRAAARLVGLSYRKYMDVLVVAVDRVRKAFDEIRI